MSPFSNFSLCSDEGATDSDDNRAGPQHSSGLYRSHARVVGDPEVMRRNLRLRIIDGMRRPVSSGMRKDPSYRRA